MFFKKEEKTIVKEIFKKPDIIKFSISYGGKDFSYLLDRRTVKMHNDCCINDMSISLNQYNKETEEFVNGILNIFGRPTVKKEGFCNLVLKTKDKEICSRLPMKFDGMIYDKPTYVCKLTDAQTTDFVEDINEKLHLNKNLDLDAIEKEVKELAKIKNDYDRRLRALSSLMQD